MLDDHLVKEQAPLDKKKYINKFILPSCPS